MRISACMIGAMWVAMVAATPEVFAQTRGSVMPNRVPPVKPERAVRQEHPLDRWAAMPPKQRDAALGSLARRSPEKAAQLQKRLANWDAMTPTQKERARAFYNKPADQKLLIKEHAEWMQTLPQERRQTIRKEINSLQSLSPEARQAEIESPSFARRFDATERERISKMVSTMEE